MSLALGIIRQGYHINQIFLSTGYAPGSAFRRCAPRLVKETRGRASGKGEWMGICGRRISSRHVTALRHVPMRYTHPAEGPNFGGDVDFMSRVMHGK